MLRGKRKVSPEEFTESWKEWAPIGGTKAVADKLGLSVSAVRSRAAYYRKQGVKLPGAKRTGGKSRIDWSGLKSRVA